MTPTEEMNDFPASSQYTGEYSLLVRSPGGILVLF